MPDKIIIPFDGKEKKDINTGGIFANIGYERLRRLLSKEEISDNEVITGLIIDDGGIKMRIDKKPL